MFWQIFATLALIGFGVFFMHLGSKDHDTRVTKWPALPRGDRLAIMIGCGLFFLGVGNLVFIAFGAYS